jgi:hypothetical protein
MGIDQRRNDTRYIFLLAGGIQNIKLALFVVDVDNLSCLPIKSTVKGVSTNDNSYGKSRLS